MSMSHIATVVLFRTAAALLGSLLGVHLGQLIDSWFNPAASCPSDRSRPTMCTNLPASRTGVAELASRRRMNRARA